MGGVQVKVQELGEGVECSMNSTAALAGQLPFGVRGTSLSQTTAMPESVGYPKRPPWPLA
ncbi:MAG: hypothetical protein WDO18_10870 [Acidobacteriota bacterium]